MTGTAADSFTLWHSILSIARHAPSPHNVQPWRVQLISSHRAELFIDGIRTLPNEDTQGSFLISAMGMFIEAIDLLAIPHGLRLEAKLHRTPTEFAELVSRPTPPGLISFASIELIPSTEVRDSYPPELFLARRTSRISLRPIPVPASTIAPLARLAEAWGHRYTHVTDSKDLELMLAHNIDAIFHDMNVPHYRDEITAWFRFTKRAAAGHSDGLDWRCMNISRVEFWLSAKFSKILLFAPTRGFLKRRYRQQLGHVPAIGILSGDFFNPENAIASGRFLLRFWLELTRLGLYLHPYGNLVTNPQAAAWLENRTQVPNAWLVFKVGYSDEPPLSHRRALSDILVSSTH
ncbi:hypothetical protein [Dyella tabacisoli]|uniref:Nitroreductase domain-containing protein n=1 Tax=Dyella tabacisoli TaxID=2282381 RepID=A0A369UHX4_9GAMM|nr:hypothetical protein [Dyella tabacisoli]RDD80171.1 hypothetical protein DVJ77_18695 [Dyella tabacisoli]